MVQTHSRPSLRTRTFTIAITVLLLGFVMQGCGGQTQAKGKALATAGAAAASNMQQYYEGLAKGEDEIYEAVLFTNRSSLTDSHPKLAEEVINAEQKLNTNRLGLIEQFKMRARAAKQLAATYTALANLSSYDASGEASRAAGDLATELQDLKILPGTSETGFDPAGLFRVAASALLSNKQSRDIRKGARAITIIVDNWKIMVDKEKQVYTGRTSMRLKTLTSLVQNLAGAQQLSGSSLFQSTLDLYNIKTSPGEKPFTTPGQRFGLRAVVDKRKTEIQNAGNTTPDVISSMLDKLKREHNKFESGQELLLSDLTTELSILKDKLDLVFPAKKNGNK